MTWEEFLTTILGLWVDTCSSTENKLHYRGRAVQKNNFLLQIEKASKNSDGDLICHVFSLENNAAHLTTSDPSGI